MKPQPGIYRVVVAALLVLPIVAAEAQWKVTPAVGVTEGYDDNVYLQNRGDLAHKSSMVTSVAPSIAATLSAKDSPGTALTLKYSPEFTFFHSESDEDYIRHTVGLSLGGKSGNWSYELGHSICLIDGEDTGPTYLAPGGIPAMGGIPLRDRRDSALYKASYKIQYTNGDWLVRPVFNAYFQDFMTEHSAVVGYENYVDRSEMSAGADVGYKAFPNTYLLLGYRYGWQHQSTLLDSPVQYSNTFHRILAGVEGKPVSWMKLSIMAGPDFRDFSDAVPAAGFGREDQIKVFVDGTVSVTPTTSDEISLLVRRYLNASFCGRAVYEDVTYQLTYRHDFSKSLSGTISVKDYEGDWAPPATRNDRIYTASISATYKFNAHLTGELGYTFDLAESNIPDTFGREFDRNFVWAGVKYAF